MLCKKFIRLPAELLVKEKRHLKICAVVLSQSVQQDIFRFIDLPIIDHSLQFPELLHYLQRYLCIFLLVDIFIKNEFDKRADPLMYDPHYIILIFQHPLVLLSALSM